jgi:hypothetical protein
LLLAAAVFHLHRLTADPRGRFVEGQLSLRERFR